MIYNEMALKGYLEKNTQCYYLMPLWKPSDFFWRVIRMRYTDYEER